MLKASLARPDTEFYGARIESAAISTNHARNLIGEYTPKESFIASIVGETKTEPSSKSYGRNSLYKL